MKTAKMEHTYTARILIAKDGVLYISTSQREFLVDLDKMELIKETPEHLIAQPPRQQPASVHYMSMPCLMRLFKPCTIKCRHPGCPRGQNRRVTALRRSMGLAPIENPPCPWRSNQKG